MKRIEGESGEVAISKMITSVRTGGASSEKECNTYLLDDQIG